MSKKIPRATHSGELQIGNVAIPCYVLEGGERVISTPGIMKSLGRPWRGRSYKGTKLPVFLEANNLKSFIPIDFKDVQDPLIFKTDKGLESEGYKARILPAICDIFLKARDAEALRQNQIKIAIQCEMLVRGLATIGIIALVDEATGYQEVRDRLALQKILDKYLTDEWAKWTKTFPDEFYKHLFRLKGLPYPPPSSGKKPSYVGHWTNDIIYSRLAPKVLTTLRDKNPRKSTGTRERKHHQYLTRDYGHPKLKEMLSNVIFLMKGCTTWGDFKRRLSRTAPKYGDTLELEIEDE